MKRTGVLVGNFEKNPQEAPRFCFMSVLEMFFAPERYEL